MLGVVLRSESVGAGLAPARWVGEAAAPAGLAGSR
jgi:hypothetical protein